MKKALVFALMVALVVSMAVPASAAVSSATGSADTLTPVVVAPAKDELPVADETVELVSVEDVAELPEEAQEIFAEAKKALAEAAPADMAVKYFFHIEAKDNASVVFEIKDVKDIVIMQFVDGKWVEVEFVVNEDGTVTVNGVVTGPMAIFTK